MTIAAISLALMLAATPETTTALPTFDALPAAPSSSDDARVKQFLGAFIGGAIGIGAGLALAPIGDGGCFTGFSCFNFGHAVSISAGILLGATGAWVGHRLMGGTAGFGATWLGVMPGLLVGAATFAVMNAMGAQTVVDLLPAIIASGVMLAGGSALALHLRSTQLDALGSAAPWSEASGSRFALETLVHVLALSGSTALTVASTALLIYSGAAGVVGVGLIGGGLALATAATTFAVHRAMGGRGSFGSAVLGFLVAASVIGTTVATFALSGALSGFGSSAAVSGAGITMMVVGSAAVGLFVPTAALEWSHSERSASALPKLSFGAAPVQGGGMMSAALTF